jgi:hypothetical protein
MKEKVDPAEIAYLADRAVNELFKIQSPGASDKTVNSLK